ncbi:MAG: DMT family transporter [Phycisphaeraceae bacterium]|nr:DMT family transporter [Phycisphaeraceae bacterium]
MPSPSLASLLLPLVLAMIAGVATAYQPGLNARFAASAGASVWGGVANFVVGLGAMVVVVAIMRPRLPASDRLAEGPWWMWLGGLCGAFFVTLAVILVPRIGAAAYLSAMIAGQLIASVVIDHFGHMGLTPRDLTPGRIVGVLLVLGGMAAIRAF